MARNGFLLIAAFAIILAISTHQVIALNCWNCITHTNPACGTPFDSSKLHKLDYGECSGLCATVVYNNTDDIQVTYRYCAKTEEDAKKQCSTSGDCVSWKTCSTDGCNSAVKYGPIALFIVIPMVIVKIFST